MCKTMHRYVDDICVMVSTFGIVTQEMEAREYAQHLIGKLIAPYQEFFELKDEASSEFIGLKVLDDDDDILLEPLSCASLGTDKCFKRVRYQHWLSNANYSTKVGILFSQLAAMVDRCNDERRLHINTAKLLLEFGVAGFPLAELKKGIYRFMFRYPYLYDPNSCLKLHIC